MKQSNTSERLKYLIQTRNLKQVDILSLCQPICKRFGIRLERNDLSQYVSGKNAPGQDKLFVLSNALNVSEAWLMGYDVPMARTIEEKTPEAEAPRVDERFEKMWAMYSALSDSEKDAADKYLAFLLDSQKND